MLPVPSSSILCIPLQRTYTMSNSKKRSAEGQGRKEEVDPTELEELEFEDPYGDDYEEDENDDKEGAEGADQEEGPDSTSAPEGQQQTVKQVWRSGVQKIEDIEDLEYDPSAYIMYHSMQTEWPCLSFDFIKDDLGDNRQRVSNAAFLLGLHKFVVFITCVCTLQQFPLTMFLVTGSQADRADRNKITLLKISDLNKTHVKAGKPLVLWCRLVSLALYSCNYYCPFVIESDDEDSDEEEEDDEGLDDDPTIEHVNVSHQGGINRIRSMPQNPGMIACMADTGKAHIYDLSANLSNLMSKGPRPHAPVTKPTFTYSGHQDEGYALDWNPLVPGRLATGDCAGKIRLWHPAAQSNSTAGAGNWQVDNTPFSGHTGSVEDLQWSPSEATVLSSASADRTVRIWDIRDNTKPQISFDAHSEDVNVLSWNKNVGYLLASGCDDGSFKVRFLMITNYNFW